MIVVAGGTGRLGTLVVRRLAGRGLSIRVLTRDSARAEHLAGSHVEVVNGDVRDRGAVAAACEGATVVVSAVHGFIGPRGISPATVDRDGNAHLIDAAKGVGADFVLMSVLGATADSPMELFRMKHAAERLPRGKWSRRDDRARGRVSRDVDGSDAADCTPLRPAARIRAGRQPHQLRLGDRRRGRRRACCHRPVDTGQNAGDRRSTEPDAQSGRARVAGSLRPYHRAAPRSSDRAAPRRPDRRAPQPDGRSPGTRRARDGHHRSQCRTERNPSNLQRDSDHHARDLPPAENVRLIAVLVNTDRRQRAATGVAPDARASESEVIS